MEIVHYALVQVVPDRVRDERVNVGVVGWDAAHRKGLVRMSESRSRLKALDFDDYGALADFRDWARGAMSLDAAPLFHLEGVARQPWSQELMDRIAKEWGGVIQITQPRASRGTLDEVVREVFSRAVRSRASQEPDAGKHVLRRQVAKALRQALDATHLGDRFRVSTEVKVAGVVDWHTFDVAVQNGAPQGLVVTPYLLNPRQNQVKRDLDAAAWAIRDVADHSTDISFALLDDSKAKTDIRDSVHRLVAHLAKDLEVEPVLSKDLADWMTNTVADPADPAYATSLPGSD